MVHTFLNTTTAHIDKGGIVIQPGLKYKLFITPWCILSIFFVCSTTFNYCRFQLYVLYCWGLDFSAFDPKRCFFTNFFDFDSFFTNFPYFSQIYRLSAQICEKIGEIREKLSKSKKFVKKTPFWVKRGEILVPNNPTSSKISKISQISKISENLKNLKKSQKSQKISKISKNLKNLRKSQKISKISENLKKISKISGCFGRVGLDWTGPGRAGGVTIQQFFKNDIRQFKMISNTSK